jgi:hypothetical protein
MKWDIAALALLAVGLGGYALLQQPYVQEATHDEAPGSRPPDQTEGDVLLLLPDAPGARADRFGQLDCSYGWFNSLWQYYGSFATALSRNLSPEFLAGRRVVIVPRRVARSMPSTGISALATFAREGGQVVLEQPGDGWERLTGVATTGESHPAQTITSVEGLDVHGRMRTHLPDVPLAGMLSPSPPLDPWPEGSALIDVDSQPGLIANRIGDGRVYTFLFEFGCTVMALQQGRPDEGMRYRPDQPPGSIPTAERIASSKLSTASVPYADLLEYALFRRLGEFRPMPRLWPFPGTKAGAMMVVHPTPDHLRASLGYLDYARKQEARSTLFAAPDRLSKTEHALVEEARAELGLLWVRGIRRPRVTETIGVGGLRPFARELSLAAQLERLNAFRGDERATRIARVEDARHWSDWSTTFRRLTAADVRLDNSFGPTEADSHGYLFGTGFPFYPIDRRGLPFPMLELPFVLHGPNLERSRLRSMLRASESYYHQSLAVSIPSYAMKRAPTPGILSTFRDTFDLARRHRHWIASAGDFADFLSARRRSVLTSQWDPDSRRLTISVHLLGARVDSLESGAYPGIAVPRTHDNQSIERLVVDEEARPLDTLVSSGPGNERIVTVPPGRHTISIFYASPDEKATSTD